MFSSSGSASRPLFSDTRLISGLDHAPALPQYTVQQIVSCFSSDRMKS
jgi:hypothetical protein